MSKPFLPGQNSKYWGYDLNNYLLSLDSRISTVENNSATNTSILQASGVGFNGTDYKFMSTESGVDKNNWTVEHIDLSNSYMKLAGTISYYSYESTGLQIRTQTFTETDPYVIFQFDNVFYTTIDSATGKIAIPSKFVQLDTNYIYYSVYLFFDEYSEVKTIRTVISPNYIFRGDMIMIGMLERDIEASVISGNYNYTFIPRIFSSGKTLYETSRDTYQSYAAVENFNYDNSSDTDLYGPFATSFDFNLMTNGINAKEGGFTLTPEVNKDNIVLSKNSIDIISGKTGNRFLVDVQSGCNLSGFDNFELVDRTYSYYLAPSGRLYIQESGVDSTPSTMDDYALELNNPLSRHPYFHSGALVYLGSAYIVNKGSNSTIVWCEAKQNGISPVVLGSGNNNHYKVWVEDQQFWFDSDKYFQINCTDYLNTNSFAMTFKYKKSPTANLITSNIELNGSSLLLTSDDRIHTSFITSNQHSFSYDGVLGLTLGSNSTDSYIMYRSLVDDNMSSWFSIRDNGLFSDNTYKLRVESYNSIYNKRFAWDFHSSDGTFETKKLKVTSEANLCEELKVVASTYSETIELFTHRFADTQSNSFLLPYEPISGNENYKAAIDSSNGKGSFYITDTQGEFSPIEVKAASSVTLYYKYSNSNKYFYLYDSNKNPYYSATLTFYYYHKTEIPSQTIVSNTLSVEGATTLSSTLSVGGATTLSSTLSVRGATTLSNTLLVKGATTIQSDVNVTGDINVTGATNYTSDSRLKNNIIPINQETCYNAVQNLDVSTYTYNTNNQDSLGLIAQDIERVLPEYAHILVHEDENGYKSVFEHKLLFILWEALKKEIKERKKLGGE